MAKIIGRKKEIEELLRLYRRDEAQLVTVQGRRASIQPTLVTSFGLKQGKNSGVFTKTIVLDDLFTQ